VQYFQAKFQSHPMLEAFTQAELSTSQLVAFPGLPPEGSLT
jgi:hypothetical protein